MSGSHSARSQWTSVKAASRWRGFYTPASQARLLIPANLTPNLLILIIDLVNKGRISNLHKYEPCLVRLEQRNTALWNILNWSFDQSEPKNQVI